MRHTQPHKTAIRAVALLAVSFFLAACNPVENKSESATLLTIESLQGKDLQGQDASFLLSDVLYQSPQTGAQSWVADAAKVTFTAQSLDPKPILGTSAYYDVQVTRYVVTYQRADGKMTPGVDVPYPIEGNLSLLVRVGELKSASFIIVRETAKQEPPLSQLYNGYAGDGISVTARVDFYGRDGANKTVKVTGYLSITFANYANQ